VREEDSALHSLSQGRAAIEVAQSFLITDSVRRNTDVQLFTSLLEGSANLIQGFKLAIETLEKIGRARNDEE
jgi:type I restriction-modification system DNA methylase subunit